VEADGVLIVGDYSTGLYGIDTANGNELWHKTGVRRGVATPTIVPVGGKDYVVVANQSGQLTCVDPLTGNNMWQVTSVDGNALEDIPYTMVNYKDVVILTVAGVDGKNSNIAGVRITTGGPVFLWKLSDSYLRTIKWDSGPRPMHTVKDSVVYYCTRGSSGNLMLLIDVYTGAILFDQGGGGDCPMIIEDRLIYGHDLYHAPGNSNSLSMYRADPDNFEKLGGWTPPHRNNGGYDQPLVHAYADGKLVFRTAVNYPEETVGGDLRCYDIEFYPQTFTTFDIDPQSATLIPGGQQAYTFFAKDQVGVIMVDTPAVTWVVSPGGGTINAEGILTAGSTSGSFKVYATAVSGGITLYDTADFSIAATQTISCYTFDSVYYLHDPFDLHCTASSGLPVTYTKVSGPFSLSGSTVTLFGIPGDNGKIIVDQPGNASWLPAPTTQLLFKVVLVEPDDTIEPVSVKESLNANDIKVWMLGGILHISNAKGMLCIYNMLGSLVYKHEIPVSDLALTNVEINMQDYCKGVYIVVIEEGVYKVIKH
jgi:hypothetical protein